MIDTLTLPGFPQVEEAAARIQGRVRRTPVLNAPQLDQALGCELWLKCEHHQPTGAFKVRGASNAIAALRESEQDGPVATHSSGNHGAALAWAAQADGRQAHIVMPENAVPEKIAAVKRFGGNVLLCPPGQAPREAGLAEQVRQGRLPVPPYDHPDIIAGQGTAALELLQEKPHLDALVAPLGGGGLLAGTLLAAAGMAPSLKVYGAEPSGAADTATSLARGARVNEWAPDTVADGLRALVGVLNFQIIRDRVSAVLLGDDAAMEDAMRLLLETTGQRLEPSAAIAVAVIKAFPEHFSGRRVGVILTGGNIDLQRYPWMREDTPG